MNYASLKSERNALYNAYICIGQEFEFAQNLKINKKFDHGMRLTSEACNAMGDTSPLSIEISQPFLDQFWQPIYTVCVIWSGKEFTSKCMQFFEKWNLFSVTSTCRLTILSSAIVKLCTMYYCFLVASVSQWLSPSVILAKWLTLRSSST